MSCSGKREMAKVQRKMALRVASAYRTVSEDAILVIANMPPVDLLATERKYLFTRKSEANAKADGRQ